MVSRIILFSFHNRFIMVSLRENAARRLKVQCNVAGGDIAGVTERMTRRLREQLTFPVGYHLEVGGEYQAQMTARRELLLLGQEH